MLRQIDVLAESGDVTTVGYGSKPDRAAEHLEIAARIPSLPQTPTGVALLALRRYRRVSLRTPAVAEARRLVGDREFDLVVANEARALPLARSVASGAPIWIDLHEWAPGERTHSLPWRLLVAPYMTWVCATFLRHAAAVTTVNDSIAGLYDAAFGTRAEIVRNARPYVDLRPSALDGDRVRLVHSGGAIPGRSLETLIDATAALDERFTLDLYLVPAPGADRYFRELTDRAMSCSRVTIRDAVPPGDLPRVLNAYDVGVFTLPPATLNHRYHLPNKLFDFVQARLALVFAPAVETDRLIRAYDLGVITANPGVRSLVAALREITPHALATYKANSAVAAEALDSSNDEATERTIITRLLAEGRVDDEREPRSTALEANGRLRRRGLKGGFGHPNRLNAFAHRDDRRFLPEDGVAKGRVLGE